MLHLSDGLYQNRSTVWLMLYVPQVWSELGRTAFDFSASGSLNTIQHIIKINTLIPLGHLTYIWSKTNKPPAITARNNYFICIQWFNWDCLIILTVFWMLFHIIWIVSIFYLLLFFLCSVKFNSMSLLLRVIDWLCFVTDRGLWSTSLGEISGADGSKCKTPTNLCKEININLFLFCITVQSNNTTFHSSRVWTANQREQVTSNQTSSMST